MFSNISKEVLESPDFKEDSVREEIITPLLKELGYGVTGANRIVRSKTLSHPFIYVGTGKHPVKTIPDYTLLHNESPILILDAKSPTEDITKRSHVQQAYSYAIHPEIKCKHFALCNGHQLVLFDVDVPNPIFTIRIHEFASRWDDVEKFLTPKYLLKPELRMFAPDFGFKLKHMGIDDKKDMIFIGVQLNLFAKISDTLISASANCDFGDIPHCTSFDFDSSLLPDILEGLPKELAEQFANALSHSPFRAAAELAIEIDISAKLGEETMGQNESFVPIVIDKVLASRFNHSPLSPRATDIPDEVYKLRDAYKIRMETS